MKFVAWCMPNSHIVSYAARMTVIILIIVWYWWTLHSWTQFFGRKINLLWLGAYFKRPRTRHVVASKRCGSLRERMTTKVWGLCKLVWANYFHNCKDVELENFIAYWVGYGYWQWDSIGIGSCTLKYFIKVRQAAQGCDREHCMMILPVMSRPQTLALPYERNQSREV